MKMRNEYPLLVSRARSVNRPAASITPRWCNSHFRVLIRVLHIEEKLKVFKYKEESSLPFPISDIRCPLMCVLQTRSPPVCSRKSSERVGSVQLDWFAGAHFSQDVCSVRSSLSPFELLLQAAQETEAFVFHKECDFIFLYSQTTVCQLESHPPLQTTSVPLIRFSLLAC